MDRDTGGSNGVCPFSGAGASEAPTAGRFTRRSMLAGLSSLAVVPLLGRGTALAAQQAGLPVKWIAPKERPLSWVCGLGIPSKSQNIPAAYKMINYYLSPKTQAASGAEGYVVGSVKTSRSRSA